MLDTHLILIDGVAGIGKTTLSQKLHQIINDIYGNAILYNEFKKHHPIHEWEETDLHIWQHQTIENCKNLGYKLLQTSSTVILGNSLFQGTVGDLIDRNDNRKLIVSFSRRLTDVRENCPGL